MGFYIKNFYLIFGFLIFMLGMILLFSTNSGLSEVQKKQRRLNIFWGIVMGMSTVALFALMMPGLEVYFGLNMPYVQIDHRTFKVFGYIQNDPNKQIGFMMLTGVLMMLPGRLITLAYYKLGKINRKRVYREF